MNNDWKLVYETLSRDHFEIRLLELCKGQWGDTIHCRLRRYGLYGRVPQYTALSYVWGSSRVSEEIVLDEVSWKVTVNLASALRYIREKDRDIILWIDALCINQSDPTERGNQVRLMRQIYSLCQKVIVFLGDSKSGRPNKHACWKKGPGPTTDFTSESGSTTSQDKDATAQLVSCQNNRAEFEKLGSAFTVFCLLKLFFSLPREEREPYDDFLHGKSSDMLRILAERLRRMLLSPWWQRIWVIQEVVLPPQASVRWGAVTAPWSMFSDAARNISSQFLDDDPELSKVLGLFARSVLKMDELRARFNLEEGVSLAYLLTGLTDKQATDERDKVFGLLGLAKSGLALKPNYEQDITSVYTSAAIAILNESGSVSSLGVLVSRKRIEGMGGMGRFRGYEYWLKQTLELIKQFLYELAIRCTSSSSDAPWPGIIDTTSVICGELAWTSFFRRRLNLDRPIGTSIDSYVDFVSRLQKFHASCHLEDFLKKDYHKFGEYLGYRASARKMFEPSREPICPNNKETYRPRPPLISWEDTISSYGVLRTWHHLAIPEHSLLEGQPTLDISERNQMARALILGSVLEGGTIRPLQLYDCFLHNLDTWFMEHVFPDFYPEHDATLGSQLSAESLQTLDRTMRHCTLGRQFEISLLPGGASASCVLRPVSGHNYATFTDNSIFEQVVRAKTLAHEKCHITKTPNYTS
ncbi:heterokaryon incompatibility protein-domain-containing protein [Bombardia bombarda]|uniref:Heterokaryon incompatibility protein-domain-containing protein n=1 Tax=Bombardia bombarda TaxID=252184 RepID=A0AA40C554_9PEZI|nr:heterokaryon incompatibility protein-domain-containing protein [Bombardia bombarda]